MAKNPYVNSEFSRITAVRLSKNLADPLVFKVEKDDLLDGGLWQGGAKLPGSQLPPRQLGVNEKVTLRVEATTQAQVVFSHPVWEAGCFAPAFFSLGTFCPLDKTNDSGTIPAARRLYWVPGAPSALMPETSLDITITALGEISWSSRGLFSSYMIKAPTTTAIELHIILLARTGDTGRILLPACGGQPATELKL
jgi:hypothetical protein